MASQSGLVAFIVINLKLCLGLEIISNPGPDSNIICGVNDTCAIICENSNGCIRSTFEVYDSAISIECSGEFSCSQVNIMSYNVPSINLTFTGYKSFESGKYISDIDDIHIDIDCQGIESCDFAEFYYYNTGHTKHLCNDINSCLDSRIECAVDSNYKCSLICNGNKSCNGNILMVSNNIDLECNSFQSCLSMKIISTNNAIIIMNSYFNGIKSFQNGELLSNITDRTINSYCYGAESCYNAKFYYFGIQSNHHSCDRNESCAFSSIYAFNSIILQCNGGDYVSCENMDIFLPTKIDELNNCELIFNGERTDPIHIYSIFGINQFTSIYCNDCGLTNIWLIYGLSFDKICEISQDCFDLVSIDDEQMESNIDIIDSYYLNIDDFDYYYDLDFRKQTFDQNVLIILINIGYKPDGYDIFYPPKLNDESGIISIFCMDYATCSDMTFNLSSTQNAILSNSISATIKNTEIYGSQTLFKYNSFGNEFSNKFYLQNTEYIIMQSTANRYFIIIY